MPPSPPSDQISRFPSHPSQRSEDPSKFIILVSVSFLFSVGIDDGAAWWFEVLIRQSEEAFLVEKIKKRMFVTAIRLCARKPKPKMKPIELKTPPEQTQTITRVIFDIVKEHGPLTIADTWEHIKEVGVRGLTSKRHMKIVLRWMRERQKLRLICNHIGPHKQFLYTTWFTNPSITRPFKSRTDSLPLKPRNDRPQP